MPMTLKLLSSPPNIGPQLDPLDEVFAAMRVENALYARLEATAPWGLSTRRGESSTSHETARGATRLNGS